mgnify:CR=1 FL=1|jgi:hypothetical protein|tara:strand:+ start:1631 stop:2104 length:474 start_codon:yes stop_codon:yes gene_type:complete
MKIKKILSLTFVLIMSTQFVFANYAFYKKVANTCKFYRVSIDEKKMSLVKNSDGSYNFTIEMESLRNNFEMVMLVGFISVGQAMNHQELLSKKQKIKGRDYSAIVPGDTEVTVTVPVSRENTIITAKATAAQIRQLSDGKVDTAAFMRLIKDSLQTL